MAVSGMNFSCRPHFCLRLPLSHCFRNLRLSSVAAIQTLDDAKSVSRDGDRSSNDSNGSVSDGDFNGPKWKKINSKELAIRSSMIPTTTKKVLSGLKRKGFEVYLVGGCVRDLILKRTPKDFDIITSAELREVVKTFSWCEIVGRRFPICHVHINNTIVEVSSFSTSARNFGRDRSDVFGIPSGCDEEDYFRWRNCLKRDFTINGLMLDPYAKIVYDYVGGIEDIKKSRVRTVIPAGTSFQEDCARILRAIRVAARLDFRFSRETAHFVKNLSTSILRLDKARLVMEMNYMLAYGSAEASLRLLWKFGLLEILLPIQAAYFVRHGFRRRDKGSNMLLRLFANLDKHLAPDKPCHGSLWVCLLAFHLALCGKPRDPYVVAAFSLAVHNGGDVSEAIEISRKINKRHDTSFHELAEPQDMDYGTLANEILDLGASIKGALWQMTDEYFVSRAMSAYPQAPYSDMVFISLALYTKVCSIFECVSERRERELVAKRGRKIDYELLAMGNLREIRHTFARVVFDTVYPLNIAKPNSDA